MSNIQSVINDINTSRATFIKDCKLAEEKEIYDKLDTYDQFELQDFIDYAIELKKKKEDESEKENCDFFTLNENRNDDRFDAWREARRG